MLGGLGYSDSEAEKDSGTVGCDSMDDMDSQGKPDDFDIIDRGRMMLSLR